MSSTDADRTQGSPSGPRRNGNAAMRALLDRPVDAGQLDENTTLVAQPHETVRTDRFDLLVVAIGEERLGLDAMLVHRVHDPAVVRRVPHRNAAHLEGVMALDGDIVPAARLDRLLDAPADRNAADPRVVLVGPPDRRWALPVDGIVGVHSFSRAEIIEPPTTVAASLRRHVSGLVRFEDGFVAIIDGDRLLDALDGGLR